MKTIKFIFGLIAIGSLLSLAPAKPSYKFAVLKYNGGGDWYANPTSLPNLVKFCNTELSMNIDSDVDEVAVGDANLFNYPFVHMTGHGNVVFNQSEAANLRTYLMAGGFLHIDDNYGMDKFVRTEIKKVFPQKELVELPFSHPIYKQSFPFSQGLPKIHEHDNKAAQGFGIIENGRVVLFYTYETDLGDGWEDQDVHNDSPELRQKALKMGANIVQFAMMGN
ncbi:MAG: DUF4159 domain-containing protein [Flavobacteriales bacterium]|jgi:hypothetical protein